MDLVTSMVLFIIRICRGSGMVKVPLHRPQPLTAIKLPAVREGKVSWQQQHSPPK